MWMFFLNVVQSKHLAPERIWHLCVFSTQTPGRLDKEWKTQQRQGILALVERRVARPRSP